MLCKVDGKPLSLKRKGWEEFNKNIERFDKSKKCLKLFKIRNWANYPTKNNKEHYNSKNLEKKVHIIRSN